MSAGRYVPWSIWVALKLAFHLLKTLLKVLKPGGLAIHTTEYNYMSDDHTRDNGETVLFLRKRFSSHCRSSNCIWT